MDAALEQRLRQYAAGQLGWKNLKRHVDSYADVLSGLGELKLRPPIADPAQVQSDGLDQGLHALRAALAHGG